MEYMFTVQEAAYEIWIASRESPLICPLFSKTPSFHPQTKPLPPSFGAHVAPVSRMGTAPNSIISFPESTRRRCVREYVLYCSTAVRCIMRCTSSSCSRGVRGIYVAPRARVDGFGKDIERACATRFVVGEVCL